MFPNILHPLQTLTFLPSLGTSQGLRLVPKEVSQKSELRLWQWQSWTQTHTQPSLKDFSGRKAKLLYLLEVSNVFLCVFDVQAHTHPREHRLPAHSWLLGWKILLLGCLKERGTAPDASSQCALHWKKLSWHFPTSELPAHVPGASRAWCLQSILEFFFSLHESYPSHNSRREKKKKSFQVPATFAGCFLHLFNPDVYVLNNWGAAVVDRHQGRIMGVALSSGRTQRMSPGMKAQSLQCQGGLGQGRSAAGWKTSNHCKSLTLREILSKVWHKLHRAWEGKWILSFADLFLRMVCLKKI